MRAEGFVTAGGRSSRMGRDKAWLELGGVTMIERVVAALRPVTARVTVIANRSEYTRLNLPVVADTYVGVGPLEAIRTALANARQPRVVLAGCDLPFVTPELFTHLLRVGGGAQAVVPLNEGGRFEPLCAVYSAAALAAVTGLIAAGERKVSRLFERVPTRFVAFAELERLDGARLFFENINSPEDYERAVRRLKRPG
ncbi:MAG TPA: molybdenum cofactor guanylyltransferase [Blastocatellia bacterium]|nr:molybdenum cofactor guanylyltransferase [Blastocatellia bacterium]